MQFLQKIKNRSALAQLLKEGYQEMADESEQIKRDFKNLDSESLKYIV